MKNQEKTTENISIKRTKTAFKNALLELVSTKSFQSISVQDLVTKSGYGRSTFYLHFENKFDLSEWIIDFEADDYVNTIFRAITENMPVDNDEAMYNTCYVILKQQMDNKIFYNALIHELIPGYSTTIFADKTYMLLMETFDYPSFYWEKDIDREFYYYIHTNTLINQIKYWEMNGYSLSLEEMAKQAHALHSMWGFKTVLLKNK